MLRDGWGPDAQHLLYDRALLGEGSHSHHDPVLLHLARAARALDPTVRCLFASRGAAALEVIGDEFEVAVIDDGPDPVALAAAAFRPDVVVYDTAVPESVPGRRRGIGVRHAAIAAGASGRGVREPGTADHEAHGSIRGKQRCIPDAARAGSRCRRCAVATSMMGSSGCPGGGRFR